MSPLQRELALDGRCPSCGSHAPTFVVGQYLAVGCAPPPPSRDPWPSAPESPVKGHRAWIHRADGETVELVLAFCRANALAHTIHIEAFEGHFVKDIGELQADWGDDRPSGVLEWALQAPGDRLVLTALRKVGATHAVRGDEYETLAILELPS